MKLIENITVDENVLDSTNAAETVAAWSASAIYLEGDERRSDTTNRIYQSLTGASMGSATISIANPGVVTKAAHGLANGDTVAFSTTGALPTGLAAATIYYVVNTAADNFQLAATAGGTAINTSGGQSGTHTLYSSPNINFDPTVAANTGAGLKWLDIAPTNAWAMFDEYAETQTEWPGGSGEVTLTPGDRAPAAVLFNLAAATVQIVMTDSVDGQVHNETYSLTDYSNVGSYFDYFFAPILRKTDLFVEGMPLYSGAELKFIIDNGAETAKCGKLVIGTVRDTGVTIMGAEFGIIDHSLVQTDDFGNTTVVPRSFRKKMDLTVIVDKVNVDEVGRLLAARRSTPTVFIGTDRFAQMQIDGIPRQWGITVNQYEFAELRINIEGLR